MDIQVIVVFYEYKDKLFFQHHLNEIILMYLVQNTQILS